MQCSAVQGPMFTKEPPVGPLASLSVPGTAHCTLHTTNCTLHTAHCTLHTAHYTLNTTHYTLHTAYCTMHTTYYTLDTTCYSTLGRVENGNQRVVKNLLAFIVVIWFIDYGLIVKN